MSRLNGFKVGTCLPVDGQVDEECLIWNHNEHGALLEFPVSARRVESFRLRCPELSIDAMCRVIWRDGREWGVEYTARSG